MTKNPNTPLKYNWNGECLTKVLFKLSFIFFLETFFYFCYFKKLFAITNALSSLTSIPYFERHTPFSPTLFSAKGIACGDFIIPYKNMIHMIFK